MSLTNDRLFDVSPFGGELTVRESRQLARSDASERSELPPVEQLEGGWRLIHGKQGILPFAHLVKCTTRESAVLTMCNVWGTTLIRFDDDQGRLCPLCHAEQQML